MFKPMLTVEINGVINTAFIESGQIIMQDAGHAVAQLIVRYARPAVASTNPNSPWSPTPLLWKARTPVIVTYGWSPLQTTDFYGYVAGSEQISTNSAHGNVNTFTYKYTIVGTSFPMQTQKNVMWKGTASYIARSIAQTNGLRAVVDINPRVFPGRAQSGQSDFRFLAELAAEIGYRFFVNNATLYFVNPLRVLETAGVARAPEFLMQRNMGIADTLMSFHSIVGETLPEGGLPATRTMTAINPQTKALVHATNEYLQFTAFHDREGVAPLLTVYKRDAVADSYHEAVGLIDADAAANAHWVTATATTIGDIRLLPGRVVSLGGQSLSAENSGVWMITKVAHNFLLNPTNVPPGRYTADIEVARDQIYDVSRTHSAEWEEAKRDVATIKVNNTWRASSYV